MMMNEYKIVCWWKAFWNESVEYLFNMKKANGENYAAGSLDRYLGGIKTNLVDHFKTDQLQLFEGYKEAKKTPETTCDGENQSDSNGNREAGQPFTLKTTSEKSTNGAYGRMIYQS
jgi:hypothetical protein